MHLGPLLAYACIAKREQALIKNFCPLKVHLLDLDNNVGGYSLVSSFSGGEMTINSSFVGATEKENQHLTIRIPANSVKINIAMPGGLI